eukprot:5544762-Alexandrium_andersonii.AAC.1
MSASLVGSEMCIRDSLLCVSEVSPELQGVGIAKQRQQNRPATQTSKRLYAVSYTHLTLPTICSV